jgi:DNA-binding transcriptional MocR family regulator
VRAPQQRVPQVRPAGIAAGLHARLELPHDLDEDEVAAQAANHGPALEGFRAYCTGPVYDRNCLARGPSPRQGEGGRCTLVALARVPEPFKNGEEAGVS